MRRSPRKQTGLSVLLLKAAVEEKAALKDPSTVDRHSVKAGRKRIARLYLASPASNPPRWQGYVRPHIAALPNLTNRSNKAVMFVPAGGRLFAVTFGHGRSLLADDVIEDGFGLRVTLNAVPDGGIRTISKKSLDAFAHHTHAQAQRAGRLGQFGVDLEQDLLQAVTGVPEDAALGVRLVGKDALGLLTRASLLELPALFERYVGEFASPAYRTKYPDIDRMAEEQDAVVIAELEAALLDKLAKGEFDRLWLAVPEIIDWAEIVGFRYRQNGSELYEDLHVSEFLRHVRKPKELTIHRLKQRRAFAIDGESGLPQHRWSVFNCLHCEVQRAGGDYVLSGGKWFRLENDFVKTVNDFVTPLLIPSTLPSYRHKDEAEYNKHAATKVAGCALMDRDMIHHGGGHSSLEFCDLFLRTGAMIHVKKYAGSGVLSHLFSQGANAAEALMFDASFRGKVRDALPSSHRRLVPKHSVEARKFHIRYAIIGRPLGGKTLADVLPFFSRVTLRRVAQRLTAAGYGVSVAWVSNK